MNDLIIISEDFETHLKLVERRLAEAGLKVNRKKFEFRCSSVTYLGYILDKDGLQLAPERIRPVLEMPSPKNVKELRRVLGICLAGTHV